MTIAEDWADTWCELRPTPALIVARINMIAEEGRQVATESIYADMDVTTINGVEYINLRDTISMINNYKWEEEEI